MQKIVKDYRDAGNVWPASAMTIARWAIKNRKWHRHNSAMGKLCALDIARGMRQEYATDKQGRRVRTKISARFHRLNLDGTDGVETLWGDMRNSDPAFRDTAEVGFTNRRSQMAGVARQFSTDLASYNENYSPGEPIEQSVDFTDDVELFAQPTEYKHGRAV